MALLKFIFVFFLVTFILLLVTAYTFFRKIINSAKRFQQRENTHQTKVNGNVLYDSRSPEESQKRIIPDDEGEYIDYEE